MRDPEASCYLFRVTGFSTCSGANHAPQRSGAIREWVAQIDAALNVAREVVVSVADFHNVIDPVHQEDEQFAQRTLRQIAEKEKWRYLVFDYGAVVRIWR